MNYGTLNKIGFSQSSTELVRSLFFIHVVKMAFPSQETLDAKGIWPLLHHAAHETKAFYRFFESFSGDFI